MHPAGFNLLDNDRLLIFNICNCLIIVLKYAIHFSSGKSSQNTNCQSFVHWGMHGEASWTSLLFIHLLFRKKGLDKCFNRENRMKLDVACIDKIYNRAPSPPSRISVLWPGAPCVDAAVLCTSSVKAPLWSPGLSSCAVGFGWHSYVRRHPRPSVLFQ